MRRVTALFVSLVIASTAHATPGIGPQIVARSLAFGAICDGSSHALSTKYATLGDAQGYYPFVTSLTQQIDYAALKAMSNFALGADGSEHGNTSPGLNIPMVIQNGVCEFGADEWLIRAADGIDLSGAGSQATVLHGSNANGVLGFDGLWYSQLSNFGVTQDSSGSTVALDVDGNVPGHPYSTFGVQANRFDGLVIGGGGGTYGMALCRQGTNTGQCSENTFNNFHGSNASEAVYFQDGFNALDNVFFGGDIQNYTKNGIEAVAGSFHVFGMSFESTTSYTQIANSGCDVTVGAAGVEDAVLLYGDRSESLCFATSAYPTWIDIRGFHHTPATSTTWVANHAYVLKDALIETGADSLGHLYVVTTAGTSNATTQPTWPSSGTVSDGGAVWTMTPYNVINLAEGDLGDTPSVWVDPSAAVKTGDAPSITAASCGGGSPALATGSNTRRGVITEGTSATGCTITWAYNFPSAVRNPPVCTISSPNGAALTGYTPSNSGLIITNASASGNKYAYECHWN